MSKAGLSWIVVLLVGFLASCEKPEVYDENAQYLIDEALIKHWADTSKTNTVLTKDPSGLYYHIIEKGTGLNSPELTDKIEVIYTGRLLSDSLVSKSTDTISYKFLLGNSIEGWKKGLPLITQGGRIRLLVPSKMAYRNYDVVTGVPKNSVLNFEIYLKTIVNKK